MTDDRRSAIHGTADAAVTSPARGYVIVTRPAGKARELVALLEEGGARVLHLPSIRIIRPGDSLPFRDAIRRLESYDWVVLTSANGVRSVRDALERQGRDPAVVRPRRLAVVGPATARASREIGWEPDLVPDTFTGSALLEALLAKGIEGLSILLPLAEAAGDVLPGGLAEAGAEVERIAAYRTVGAAPENVARVREAIAAGEVDLVTFTSPSTAEHFLEAVGREARDIPAAVIGPVTADAARELGYEVVAVAEEHTVPGLARAALGTAALRGGTR